MALQKNIVDDYGATHESAYARITSISYRSAETVPTHDVATPSMNIEVAIHHNAAARSKGTLADQKPAFYTRRYSVIGSEFNTYFAESVLNDVDKTSITQSYAYIKAQTTPINFTTGTTNV